MQQFLLQQSIGLVRDRKFNLPEASSKLPERIWTLQYSASLPELPTMSPFVRPDIAARLQWGTVIART